MSYIFQPFRFELREAILRYGGVLHGRVLDVGAGAHDRYGGFTNAKEYVRMNISDGPGTDLVGRAESIPAPDNSFDAVLCTQVMGDIYEVEKALQEFNRVLVMGGTVLLTESFMDPLHDEPHDFWRFTPHSLRKLFQSTGLHIEKLEPIGGYHTVLAQFKIRYRIERWHLYDVWFSRIASFYFRVLGRIALWRDARDPHASNKLFAHGWIVIAKKK